MKIIECPRDAMQGITDFIPTEEKVSYINAILKVGFDTVDFGSFVSPKAIPQLCDTAEVLNKLELSKSNSKLLAIVANQRGAEDALNFEEISYLGFPLSLSETFQKKNTNKSINEAFESLKTIQEMTLKNNRALVVYLSMGFGNPYGDVFEHSFVQDFINKLVALDVKIISLADTVGIAKPDQIESQLKSVIGGFRDIEFGAHLHVTPDSAYDKISAVLNAGCERIDGAIGGFGGCPMATDMLTGNLNTNTLIDLLKPKYELNYDMEALQVAQELSSSIFTKYH